MAGSSGGELRAPIFNGENYDFWSIRMKTIFKSRGLWDFVIKGFDGMDLKKSDESDDHKKETVESSGKGMVAEVLMKDAKALGLIQGAVLEEIFPRISHEETLKGAWSILQQEFHGDKQIGILKTEQRRHLLALVWMPNRLRLENRTASRIRTGNPKARSGITRQVKALKLPANTVVSYILVNVDSRASQSVITVISLATLQKTAIARKHLSKSTLLLKWKLHQQCFMLAIKVTAKVEMGTGQLVEVTGKGTVVVETKAGKRHIKAIMLVPGLKENLLNVGQIIEHGYCLVFGDHKVEIYNDSSHTNLVAEVQMKGNRSFPLKLHAEMHFAYRASVDHSTDL
ncbi:hypothetical protein L3X38_008772 [Prunus dulcis]|uniref:Retrovirus-related Pol polyprotein from transposon TNT 1-94-like beta-barrel domain-containing protein n=1 Tax=Prunus dulcis TaxID=3755 RepID=A0AAD5F782_PRUDU|nr:hypothetical protein L3X38_008772 [Prunus dulcis]